MTAAGSVTATFSRLFTEATLTAAVTLPPADRLDRRD